LWKVIRQERGRQFFKTTIHCEARGQGICLEDGGIKSGHAKGRGYFEGARWWNLGAALPQAEMGWGPACWYVFKGKTQKKKGG